MTRAAPILVLSLLGTRCAAPLPVASAPDAATEPAGTGAVAAPDLVIRVETDGLDGRLPAAGFLARAEDGRGQAAEATTDVAGNARLAVGLSRGPWDVTVARRGCRSAVSVLDVTGPIDGPIYVPGCGGDPRASVPHGVTGAITGRLDPADTVTVVGTGGEPAVARGGRYEARFLAYANAPPLRLAAVETDPFGHPRNAVALAPVTRPDHDFTADLALPPVPRPIARSTLVIDLPPGAGAGVTAATPGAFVPAPTAVLRGGDAVGWGVLELGTAPGAMTPRTLAWRLEVFDGDLAPDVATTSFTWLGERGTLPLTYALATRTVADGARIALGDVRALGTAGTATAAGLTLVADATGYDRAGFEVAVDGSAAPGTVWRGFTYAGARFVRGALPHLPGEMILRDLTLGFRASTIDRVTVCVERRRPGGTAPWSGVDADREVRACTATGSRLLVP